MTHHNFIYGFVKTPLMKYDMTLKRMIQAHNLYFVWIFSHFSQNCEKSVPFANKRYQSPNFEGNWCIIWISNKICLKGAIKKWKNIGENEIHWSLILFNSIDKIFKSCDI
jgi:hypothetical protein